PALAALKYARWTVALSPPQRSRSRQHGGCTRTRPTHRDRRGRQGDNGHQRGAWTLPFWHILTLQTSSVPQLSPYSCPLIRCSPYRIKSDVYLSRAIAHDLIRGRVALARTSSVYKAGPAVRVRAYCRWPSRLPLCVRAQLERFAEQCLASR